VKITAVKAFPVAAKGRHALFVKVYTDAGVTGVGEGGFWGRELAVAEAVRSAERLLIGEDPTRIDHIWQTLYRGTFWRGGPVLGTAISAIDIALWDLNAKALGVPVYRLLGGKSRDRVRCYAHLGDVPREEMVRRAKALVADGWTVVRYATLQDMATGVLEPRESIRRCVGDTAAVRAAVGEDVDIVIDFHLRLNPNHAIELGRALEPYRPFFLEDPIRCENPGSYRLVRDHVNLPIATGEHLVGKWEFRELVEGDLIDYARPDLCVFGGLTEAKKLAGWCETHYINVAPHNPLGPISTAACVALCTAVPNFGVLELSWRPGQLADVVKGGPRLEGGYLVPSDEPGLGVDIDDAAAAELADRFERWDLPRLRRSDGSFTDW
jgi:galactonate dehydratase